MAVFPSTRFPASYPTRLLKSYNGKLGLASAIVALRTDGISEKAKRMLNFKSDSRRGRTSSLRQCKRKAPPASRGACRRRADPHAGGGNAKVGKPVLPRLPNRERAASRFSIGNVLCLAQLVWAVDDFFDFFLA